MLKGIARITVLTLLVIATFFLIRRYPHVRDFGACYQQAYLIVNEKNSITRTTYLTEGKICEQHKQTLLPALKCDQAVKQNLNAGSREEAILSNLGRLMAHGTISINELLERHNHACTPHRQQIQYDLRAQMWF